MTDEGPCWANVHLKIRGGDVQQVWIDDERTVDGLSWQEEEVAELQLTHRKKVHARMHPDVTPDEVTPAFPAGSYYLNAEVEEWATQEDGYEFDPVVNREITFEEGVTELSRFLLQRKPQPDAGFFNAFAHMKNGTIEEVVLADDWKREPVDVRLT